MYSESAIMGIFRNFTKFMHPLSLKIIFHDRQKAGQMLGNNLTLFFKSKSSKKDTSRTHPILVIGIPRGGLVVAYEIANKLSCDLDLVYPVRIVSEDNETTLGSILVTDKDSKFKDLDLNNYLNTSLIFLNDGPAEEYLNSNKSKITKVILEKSERYSHIIHSSIKGKTVILVDDGVYSGATALVALRWIRSQEPEELIFATPIAPTDITSKIKNDPKILLDHAEILKVRPSSRYRTVDYYYKHFEDVSDAHINRIIQSDLMNHHRQNLF